MLLVTLSLVCSGFACAQALDTDEAKEAYSLGASVGIYLSGQIYKQTEMGLPPVNMDLVREGLLDALKSETKLSDEDMVKYLNARAEKLNDLQQAALEKIREERREQSSKFLEENKAKKGVVQTESGLQYEVITEGTGPQPTEIDVVTMEYDGKLIDGTYFEGSETEKKTDKFVVMALVPGLKEGISLMKEGSEYRFVVPAALAYGVDGAGPIPPESALIFDMKLIKVEKPGAHSSSENPGGQPKKEWPHG